MGSYSFYFPLFSPHCSYINKQNSDWKCGDDLAENMGGGVHVWFEIQMDSVIKEAQYLSAVQKNWYKTNGMWPSVGEHSLGANAAKDR